MSPTGPRLFPGKDVGSALRLRVVLGLGLRLRVVLGLGLSPRDLERLLNQQVLHLKGEAVHIAAVCET